MLPAYMPMSCRNDFSDMCNVDSCPWLFHQAKVA